MEGKINKTENSSISNCKHNKLTQDFCNECLMEAKANQSIWPKIERLRQNSRIDRDTLEPNCNIKIEGVDLKINTITSKDDPALVKILDLLEKYFREDELNTRESFMEKVEGVDKSGKKRPQYRCFYVDDNEGKTVAARISENFPLVDKDGNETNKNVFLGLYIVVDKDYRSTGIARELYISALIDAAIQSEKENKDLSILIAECTPASEKLMNTVGLKKIYFKNGDTLKEYEYYQPVIEFDKKTGDKITQEIAEHIMITTSDEKEVLTKELFYESLKSLYRQNESAYSEGVFENNDAYLKYKDYYKSLNERAKNGIEEGELVALNIEEQLEKESQGMRVINFEKANATK